jgi:hypothetical protein
MFYSTRQRNVIAGFTFKPKASIVLTAMTNLAEDFNQIVTGITERLKAQGVEKNPFSTSRSFKTLDQAQQKAAITRVRRQLDQMEMLKPDIREFEKVSLLCTYHSLKSPTESVFKKVSEDHFWEIIDFDMNQVYRNKRIYELGNYSVEDYETYSPWELFTRPKAVLDGLIKLTDELKKSNDIIDLSSLGSYVIQELLTDERAVYEVKHDFVCALKDRATGENKSFINAFRARKVEDRRIAILN